MVMFNGSFTFLFSIGIYSSFPLSYLSIYISSQSPPPTKQKHPPLPTSHFPLLTSYPSALPPLSQPNPPPHIPYPHIPNPLPTQTNPDPGFCNTNLRLITLDINMSLPENQSPKPQLGENEFIDCFTVPLRDLYTTCQRLEREGFAIDARVGTLAEGLEVARRVGL